MSTRSSPFKSKYSGDKPTFSRTSFGRALISPKKFHQHHNEANGATASSHERARKLEKVANQPKPEDAVNKRKSPKDSATNGSALTQSSFRSLEVEKQRNGRSGENQPRHRRCYTNSKRTESAKTKKQLKKVVGKDEALLEVLDHLKWNSSSDEEVKFDDISLCKEKKEKNPPEKNPSPSLKSASFNDRDPSLKSSAPNNAYRGVKQPTQIKVDSKSLHSDAKKKPGDLKFNEEQPTHSSHYFCDGTNNMMNLEGSNINGVKILLRGDLLGALNCLFPQLDLVPSKSDPRKPILDQNFSYFSDSFQSSAKTAGKSRGTPVKKTGQSPESKGKLQVNNLNLGSSQENVKAADTDSYENFKSADVITKKGPPCTKDLCDIQDITDQPKKFNDEKGRTECMKMEEHDKDELRPKRTLSTTVKTSALQSDEQKTSPEKLEDSSRNNRYLYSSVVRSSILKDTYPSSKEENKSPDKLSSPVGESETTRSRNQIASNNRKPIHYDLDELEKDIVAMIDKLLDEPDELDESLYESSGKQQVTTNLWGTSPDQQTPKQTDRIYQMPKTNPPENQNKTSVRAYDLRPENTIGGFCSPPEMFIAKLNPYSHTPYQQNSSNITGKDARFIHSNYSPPIPSPVFPNNRQAVLAANSTNFTSIGGSTVGTPFLSSSFTQLGVSNYQYMTPPQVNISDEMLKAKQLLASRSLYNQYAGATTWNGYPLIANQQQYHSNQLISGNYGRPSPSRPGQAGAIHPNISTSAMNYWEGRAGGLGSIISVTDLEQQALEQYANSDESLNARFEILEKEAEEQYNNCLGQK